MRTIRNFMNVAIVITCLLLAGCTGLQAKSTTANNIRGDAAIMAVWQMEGHPAVSLTLNAERFAFYHQTATVNPWAYWFGGKTILCTAAIYSDLMQKAALSAEYDRRMKATTQPAPPLVPVNPTAWLAAEAQWMANIERERTGK
jgi:hypothetical protein